MQVHDPLPALVGRQQQLDQILSAAQTAGIACAPFATVLRQLVRDGGRPVNDTGGELEVLTEVARGLSNREVGEALFISAKTVSVHVTNLMAKLGVDNRTAAAAKARELGLV